MEEEEEEGPQIMDVSTVSWRQYNWLRESECVGRE